MKFAISIVILLGVLSACGSQSSVEQVSEVLAQAEPQGFEPIAESNIYIHEFPGIFDYTYDPYSVSDLISKFNKPSDVDVIEGTITDRLDPIIDTNGSIFSQYQVTVDKQFNPASNQIAGDSITVTYRGGCAPLSQYEQYLKSDSNITDRDSEWKSSNYYCIDGQSQEQSIDYKDKFLMILTDAPYENSIMIGNGLMEITGDDLVNNSDVDDGNLKLLEVENEILSIYK